MSPGLSLRLKLLGIDALVGIIAVATLCFTPGPAAISLLVITLFFLFAVGIDMAHALITDRI